jgi:transposase-like protein
MAVRRPKAGRDYPRDFREFRRLLGDDEACYRYLERMRWGKGFECPHCLTMNSYWQMGDGRRRCKECRGETSVTAGTIFHGTRYEISFWFAAIWHVVTQKNGVSALGLQRAMGFKSYQTAWAWLHKLRRAMVRRDRPALDGTVEVDETHLGGVRVGQGRGRGMPNKTLVAIAVEDLGASSGRVRREVIPNATQAVLHDFVTRNVYRGATIKTDGHRGYSGLDRLGYTHIAISQRASSQMPHQLLPHVHRVSSLLKRWLLGTHQGAWGRQQLEYYLDEYVFRFNRRRSKSRGMLFYRLIEQAVVTEPQPYKDLVA